MKKIYFIISLFFAVIFNTSNSYSDNLRFGAEGGLTWADMRAEETAQTLANLSGSTVTYTYDEATWMGRLFADYELSTEMSVEIGFFFTGSLDAQYTISGSSATEGYTGRGIDVAAVFNQDELFFKVGMHSSELEGNASLTIGGTKYAVSDTISGSGYLVGGGFEADENRVGLTYYSDVGGDADSDMLFLYYGVMF
tara:strand:+ start:228 stop:815 length:588 start_codon:yes stop_codon:yes gene_type:complete